MTENRLMVARREGGRGLGEKVEGTEKYKVVVTEQSRDVKYSTGNIVSKSVIKYVWCQVDTGNIWGTLCKVYDFLTTMLYT